MTASDLLVHEIVSPSKLVFVELRTEGLSVPLAPKVTGYEHGPRLQLDLARLQLLENLSRDDGRPLTDLVEDATAAGASADELHAFLGELREASRLFPAEDRPSPEDDTAARRAREAPAGSAPEPLAKDRELVIETPRLFRLRAGAFEFIDFHGRLRMRLSGIELLAASRFREPRGIEEAWELQSAEVGETLLPRGEFDDLVTRLGAADALHVYDLEKRPQQKRYQPLPTNERPALERHFRLVRAVSTATREHDHAMRQRAVQRTRVYPVHFNSRISPLALGMIVAYAKAHRGGLLEEHFEFRPEWWTKPKPNPAIAERPGSIYLFSNYMWSHNQNLEYSRQIKELNPRNITIHGGPDTPKYEADVEEHFRQHPHVDIAVHGEGEVTAAEILEALSGWDGDDHADLSVLRDVPGLSFRDGDRVTRTADRERIADLDSIPSPYLTGLFDAYGEAATPNAIIETNRGCPYGCTFCDWGSATLSRVRKFSMERVLAELEWCAQHKVEMLAVADANYGMFERDVEIAEKVVDLKRQYGYPTKFGTNYAKNTVKHLKKIVSVLVEEDILAQGILSLQSMDTDTLKTIKRSNIKLDRYEDLASEFRNADLPLYVDLMMGLPGSTMESFRDDLQECVNREVNARVFPTRLLVNSPMNAPDYREEHKIVDKPGQLVLSSASFTRSQWDDMMKMRKAFLIFEKFGVLRHVSRYVRGETGTREIDFLEQLRADITDDPERWPTVAFTLQLVPYLLVEPVSWRLFIDEIGDYLVGRVGIADDSALETVLDVQHALLPSIGRSFPETIELRHDYAAWHRHVLDLKDAGYRYDWPEHAERLRGFGPGSLTVEDPSELCDKLGLGVPDVQAPGVEADPYGNWEFESAVSRAIMPTGEAGDL